MIGFTYTRTLIIVRIIITLSTVFWVVRFSGGSNAELILLTVLVPSLEYRDNGMVDCSEGVMVCWSDGVMAYKGIGQWLGDGFPIVRS